MRDDDDDAGGLGPCCVCEGSADVDTFVMLPYRAPMPGRGWGCVVCGLASDGAIAVLCNRCLAQIAPAARLIDVLRFACRGYPGSDGRIPIDHLTGAHAHDAARHAADDDL